MKKIRFLIAMLAAKCALILLKLLRRTASYTPGYIALKIFPDFLGSLKMPKTVICVTGTNGKTSTAVLLFNILKNANKKCGLISTIGCFVGDEALDTGGGGEVSDICSSMTTPDPAVLYSVINEMKKRGCKYIVMEASSHALEQGRLDGLDVKIGVFTNLSPEHLDYHKDMEDYFRAKEKLFEMCSLCVMNIDDRYGERLFSKYRGRSFSISAKKPR